MSHPARNGANLRLLASVLNAPREATASFVSRTSRRTFVKTLSSISTKPLRPSHASSKTLVTPPACRTGHPQFSTTSKSSDAHASSTASSSSVNATEVSHFSRLASSWWNPQGPSRILHLMNPLRHDFISECLSTSSADFDPSTTTQNEKHTYLDIGCGGGIFAESAARLPHTSSVVAIDPTPEVLTIAQEHARNDPLLSGPNSKLSYLNTSIEDLSSTEHGQEKFDIITLFEVLEHVHSPSTFLRNVTAHLKPGGWLIVSTISRTPLSFFVTKVVAEFPGLGPVPRGTHTWSKYILPSELAWWFEKDGRDSSKGEEGEEYGGDGWGKPVVKGVAYVPGMGWQWVPKGWGLDGVGNYFFGIQKKKAVI